MKKDKKIRNVFTFLGSVQRVTNFKKLLAYRRANNLRLKRVLSSQAFLEHNSLQRVFEPAMLLRYWAR